MIDQEPPNDHPDLSPPDGRLLWTTPEMVNRIGRPWYSTKEVAWTFFGRSPNSWLYKLLLVEGRQILSHPEVGTLDVPRAASTGRRHWGAGDRRWRLYDIELYAHILASHRVIQGKQLVYTITLVKTSAQMYGFIP